MGRRKIQIAPILNDRNRSVTYLKRKAGLFKKAHELSVLTQADVAVIVFGSNGKLAEFCSADIDELLLRYTEYAGPVERRGPSDFTEQGDDEDADDGGDGEGSDGGGEAGGLDGGESGGDGGRSGNDGKPRLSEMGGKKVTVPDRGPGGGPSGSTAKSGVPRTGITFIRGQKAPLPLHRKAHSTTLAGGAQDDDVEMADSSVKVEGDPSAGSVARGTQTFSAAGPSGSSSMIATSSSPNQPVTRSSPSKAGLEGCDALRGKVRSASATMMPSPSSRSPVPGGYAPEKLTYADLVPRSQAEGPADNPYFLAAAKENPAVRVATGPLQGHCPPQTLHDRARSTASPVQPQRHSSVPEVSPAAAAMPPGIHMPVPKPGEPGAGNGPGGMSYEWWVNAWAQMQALMRKQGWQPPPGRGGTAGPSGPSTPQPVQGMPIMSASMSEPFGMQGVPIARHNIMSGVPGVSSMVPTTGFESQFTQAQLEQAYTFARAHLHPQGLHLQQPNPDLFAPGVALSLPYIQHGQAVQPPVSQLAHYQAALAMNPGLSMASMLPSTTVSATEGAAVYPGAPMQHFPVMPTPNTPFSTFLFPGQPLQTSLPVQGGPTHTHAAHPLRTSYSSCGTHDRGRPASASNAHSQSPHPHPLGQAHTAHMSRAKSTPQNLSADAKAAAAAAMAAAAAEYARATSGRAAQGEEGGNGGEKGKKRKLRASEQGKEEEEEEEVSNRMGEKRKEPADMAMSGISLEEALVGPLDPYPTLADTLGSSTPASSHLNPPPPYTSVSSVTSVPVFARPDDGGAAGQGVGAGPGSEKKTDGGGANVAVARTDTAALEADNLLLADFLSSPPAASDITTTTVEGKGPETAGAVPGAGGAGFGPRPSPGGGGRILSEKRRELAAAAAAARPNVAAGTMADVSSLQGEGGGRGKGGDGGEEEGQRQGRLRGDHPSDNVLDLTDVNFDFSGLLAASEERVEGGER